MTVHFSKLPASRYNPVPFRHGWTAQAAHLQTVTLQERDTLDGSVWLAFANNDWKRPIAQGSTRRIAFDKARERLAR